MSPVTLWSQRIADAVELTVRQRFCWPTATYRLQFGKGRMTFGDAADLVPYLRELGVSHLYASPYLKARSGCEHGYAIVDYGQLNPDLGAAEDFRRLVDALHGHGMEQILDVVSNHMSATPAENAWWNDVLENGPSSPFAACFDIDWHPIKEELQNKILLPILGDQYGQVLESGELKLEYHGGAFIVRYYQVALPLDPRTYRTILMRRLDDLKTVLPSDSEDLRELESIVTALEHLPAYVDTEPERVAERQREKEVAKGRLAHLVERSAAIAEFIHRNVEELNGVMEDPDSFNDLDKLLDAQVYRLSHWKAAADEINYRRFFDINDLAAVCMEDPRVFQASHRLVFDLLIRGDAAGLRIDHIDGLYDPMEYLRRLQWGYLRALGWTVFRQLAEAHAEMLPGRILDADLGEMPPWNELEPTFLENMTARFDLLAPTPACVNPPEADAATSERLAENIEKSPLQNLLPLYVVVEKILGPEEPLPESWLVAGTTGYDFLNAVNGLFVERTGLEELAKAYDRFIDGKRDFREVALQSKRLILRAAMSSDLQLLAYRLNRISERHRRSRDFTLNTLHVALREILACFPVYRTYIHAGSLSDRDRQFVQRAVAQAKRRNPAINAAVFDFVRDVLLLEQPAGLDPAGRHERDLFVGRFQQVTSPVMAKGIEDTAFYRYFPLASLNEVGGDPVRTATAVEEFHRQNATRQNKWPRSLVATTTHDTKRSEDVRARIDILAEIPHLWRKAVNRWARLNRRHQREVDGQPAPSRNDEYLFYQSLLGVWPLKEPGDEGLPTLVERLQFYMEKATREAKIHTSWINPNSDYDTAIRQFIAAVLDGRARNRFLAEFRTFHEHVVNWGLFTALSQTLLKLTSPACPTSTRGRSSGTSVSSIRTIAIRWTLPRPARFSLGSERKSPQVNRRSSRWPVDSPGVRATPRLKLFVTWQTLQFRREHADLFQEGDYIPLNVRGSRSKHVCAFARISVSSPGAPRKVAVIIVPRLIAQLTPAEANGAGNSSPLGPAIWEDTHVLVEDLAVSSLENLFTGQIELPENGLIPVARALSDFPVAVLTNGQGNGSAVV